MHGLVFIAVKLNVIIIIIVMIITGISTVFSYLKVNTVLYNTLENIFFATSLLS